MRTIFTAIATKKIQECGNDTYIPEIISSSEDPQDVSIEVNNWRQSLPTDHTYVKDALDPIKGKVEVYVNKMVIPEKDVEYVVFWGMSLPKDTWEGVLKEHASEIGEYRVKKNEQYYCGTTYMFDEATDQFIQKDNGTEERVWIDKHIVGVYKDFHKDDLVQNYVYVKESLYFSRLTKVLVKPGDYSSFYRTEEEHYIPWREKIKEFVREYDLPMSEPSWVIVPSIPCEEDSGHLQESSESEK